MVDRFAGMFLGNSKVVYCEADEIMVLLYLGE
jgi:hypothetical protein